VAPDHAGIDVRRPGQSWVIAQIEERRRDIEAVDEAIETSVQAIARSRATLARCVAWFPARRLLLAAVETYPPIITPERLSSIISTDSGDEDTMVTKPGLQRSNGVL
jgi:hypothetical protein